MYRYIDTVERADMILDEDGHIIAGGILGEMMMSSKLTGAKPEVAISLRDKKLLSNVCLHPSVNTKKFDRDGSIVCVPPDGSFSLLSYYIEDSNIRLPFHFSGSLKW